MDMKVIGFTVGVIASLTIALFCIATYKHVQKNQGKLEYDERQRAVQGRAYCAAFYTLLGYVVANALYEMLYSPWGDSLTVAMFGVFIGISVFGMVCIFNDAYTPLRKKPGTYILLFLALAAFNAAIGYFNLHGESVFENGVLTFRCVNFAVAGMLVLVAIVYGARLLYIGLRDRGESENGL